MAYRRGIVPEKTLKMVLFDADNCTIGKMNGGALPLASALNATINFHPEDNEPFQLEEFGPSKRTTKIHDCRKTQASKRQAWSCAFQCDNEIRANPSDKKVQWGVNGWSYPRSYNEKKNGKPPKRCPSG